MGLTPNDWYKLIVDVDLGRERRVAEIQRRKRCRVPVRFLTGIALGLFGTLGLVPDAGAWVQAPAGEADAQPGAAPSQGSAEALSVRYRFLERYSAEEDSARPDLVTQYQVGIRQTRKEVREKQQGAPERFEFWTQTIYTERAGKVTNLGDVSEAVRRYDKFFQKRLPTAAIPKTPLFEGLTVWVTRGKFGAAPQILSLTENRPLREAEFKLMLSQPSLPPLKALLPTAPRRVGDTWRVPRESTFYLFWRLPEPDDYALDAKLTDVHKAATGTKLVAVIALSGPLTLADGPSLVNGEIHFTFEPQRAVLPSPGAGEEPKADGGGAGSGSSKKNKEGVADAQGWITAVKLARSVDIPEPEGEGRLKTTVTHEIVMGRRLLSEVPNQPGTEPPAPLLIPNPPPTATDANSWLVYEDPSGRFSFRHPQELQATSDFMEPDTVQLIDQRPEVGKDVFVLQLPPGTDDPQADRRFHSVDQFKQTIEANWSRKKADVVRGPEEWLPEPDWAPFKLKVYRKELGVKTQAPTAKGTVERIYLDYYFVLSNRNDCFHVQSMTIRDDHVAFRTQAERIIKSMEFGPTRLKGSPAKPPAATGAPPPPPRR